MANRIRVSLDKKPAEEGLGDLRRDFRRTGGAIEREFGGQLNRGLSGLLPGVQGLGRGFGTAGLAAAGATAAVAGLVTATAGLVERTFAFTKSVAAQNSEQRDLAERLGVSIEQYTALVNIAGRYSATNTNVARTLDNLQKAAVTQRKRLEELGVEVEDTNGNVKGAVDLFLDFGDALRRLGSESEQVGVIRQITRRNGEALAQVFRLQREELEGLIQAEIEEGRVISRRAQFLEAEFSEALEIAGQNTRTLSRIFGEELFPTFSPVLRAFNDFVQTNRDQIRPAAAAFAEGIATIVDASFTVAQAVPAASQAVLDLTETVVRFTPARLTPFGQAILSQVDFEGLRTRLDAAGTAVADLRTRIENERAKIRDIADFVGPFPETDLERRIRIEKEIEEEKKKDEEKKRQAKQAAEERARERNRIEGEANAARLRATRAALSEEERIFFDTERKITEAQGLLRGERLERAVRGFEAEGAARLAALTERLKKEEESQKEADRLRADRQLEADQRLADRRAELAEREADRRTRAEERGLRATISAARSLGSGLLGLIETQAEDRVDAQLRAAKAAGKSEEELAALRDRLSRQAFETQKGVRSAEAAISTAAGVARALADHPFPFSLAIGGLVAAAGAVQIAAINSAQFAGGGSAPSSASSSAPGGGSAAVEPPRFSTRETGRSDPRPIVVNITNTVPTDPERQARALRQILREGV